MARSNTPYRAGSGAMNLDSKGRVNRFNTTSRKSQRNFWRRKSSGGAGG